LASDKEGIVVEEKTANDEQQLRRFSAIVAVAATAAGISALAGVSLWIADPAEGTSPDAVLGFVAAVGGLLSGALFGAAAIYAQVKNLWRFAPRWFRYTSWAILIVVAIVALVSSAARSA
jgi:hypothetical protein